MSFTLSGALFVGIRPLGGGEPDADYYPAKITKVYHEASDKVDSRRMDVVIGDTGFTKMDWLNLPNEQLLANGTADEKKTQRGRIGKIRQVLESIGYDAAQIEGGVVADNWFVDRVCYVEWVPGDGTKDSYGEIQAFIPKVRFDAVKAAGTKPTRSARSGGAQGGPPAAPGSAPSTYTAPPAPPAPPGAPPAPPAPPSVGSAPAAPPAPPAPPMPPSVPSAPPAPPMPPTR